MIESNYLASEQGKLVKGVAIYSNFFTFPLAGVLLFLMFLANDGRREMEIIISITVVPFMVFALAFIIYTNRTKLKRWNRTIDKISIESPTLTIETFPIFWYKKRKYIVSISGVVLKKTTFPWYGTQRNEKKDGIVIKIGKEEFYLVNDYFDDYEDIYNALNIHS